MDGPPDPLLVLPAARLLSPWHHSHFGFASCQWMGPTPTRVLLEGKEVSHACGGDASVVRKRNIHREINRVAKVVVTLVDQESKATMVSEGNDLWAIVDLCCVLLSFGRVVKSKKRMEPVSQRVPLAEVSR
jgi:hypothetical protein